MEPIRILHIVTYMGRGGLESMLMNYYRHIDRTKVQFDFLVHRDFEADYDAEILSLGGQIHPVSKLVPWSKAYRRELKDFFHAHPEYRIVHVHQDCLSAVALQCAKECDIPVRIAHSHNSNQDKNLKYLIKLHYMKQIPTYTTDFFACSDTAGKWMFHNNNFKVLNNAIDTKQYLYTQSTCDTMQNQLHLQGKFVLGHVGRFRKQKNHDFLIDIFAAVVSKHPDSVLLLAGDGDLQPIIEEKVQKLGLTDKVKFLGARSDVNRLLQAMDVFVFPSLYEGLPVTMVEAQAAGLPCVISENIPSECIITDLVTQMSLQESADTWANEILKHCSDSHEDTTNQIRKAGFDIEENALRLQEFYFRKYEASFPDRFDSDLGKNPTGKG